MEMVTVKVDGGGMRVHPETTLYEISRQFPQEGCQIILARVNGQLRELQRMVRENDEITFVTTRENAGHMTYKRSMTLLLLKAMHDVIGQENIQKISVLYSISKGYYCELESDTVVLNQELLDSIKRQMKKLIAEGLPIDKNSISTDQIIEKFHNYGMYDKEKLFQYRRSSRTNLYRIGNFEDYFYGYMAPSTACLKLFELYLYEEGFVLQMPDSKDPSVVPAFCPQDKLFSVLKEAKDWGKTMEVDTIGSLNDVIAGGAMNDLILVQEALQEKKLAYLADQIAQQNRKIILIAGPSSSGKTTFSHRLSIQLRIHGLHPHPIAVDDYFLDRELSPKDEDGEFNFEVLEAIDVAQFNQDMKDLLEGRRVNMPRYNFVSGKREYKNDYKQLGKEDILVIEGIHGLNEKLTINLPSTSMFKIYISALTQVNVDEHNRIPTTDARLIRRIVRDARTRGTSAAETISRWGSVRRGEEQNIFPFQEQADAMFNSALIYELPVLKQYAEPLLFAIGKEEGEYQEAKRLLKFLDYVLGISSDVIPKNSLIREFIGGSCFHV